MSLTMHTTPVCCRLQVDGLWGRAMNSWATAVAMDWTEDTGSENKSTLTMTSQSDGHNGNELNLKGQNVITP